MTLNQIRDERGIDAKWEGVSDEGVAQSVRRFAGETEERKEKIESGQQKNPSITEKRFMESMTSCYRGWDIRRVG